jgi:hypothetical protein
MFRFHILGMCVCVHSRNSLDVMMLNALASNVPGLPYHLPSLFAPRAVVRDYSLPRLPSVARRFTNRLSDTTSLGWGLTGLTAQLDGSGPPVMKEAAPANLEHPDMAAPDWSSLHWILDASRMFPHEKLNLNPQFKVLGPRVSTILRFRGGRVEGGRPLSDGHRYVWRVREGYQQAFTDTIDVIYDDGVPTVEFIDADNQYAGSVTMDRHGEAWVVNEAPERVAMMEMLQPPAQPAAAGEKLPSSTDTKVYAAAFLPAEATVGVEVTAARKLSGEIFSGEFCSMIRFKDL